MSYEFHIRTMSDEKLLETDVRPYCGTLETDVRAYCVTPYNEMHEDVKPYWVKPYHILPKENAGKC